LGTPSLMTHPIYEHRTRFSVDRTQGSGLPLAVQKKELGLIARAGLLHRHTSKWRLLQETIRVCRRRGKRDAFPVVSEQRRFCWQCSKEFALHGGVWHGFWYCNHIPYGHSCTYGVEAHHALGTVEGELAIVCTAVYAPTPRWQKAAWLCCFSHHKVWNRREQKYN
jgi:hypothetical protein